MRLGALLCITKVVGVVIAQTGSKANPPTVPSTYSVTAGKPSTFTWKPTTQGPVTLTLRSGAASDLNTGTVIACKLFVYPTMYKPFLLDWCASGHSKFRFLHFHSPFGYHKEF